MYGYRYVHAQALDRKGALLPLYDKTGVMKIPAIRLVGDGFSFQKHAGNEVNYRMILSIAVHVCAEFCPTRFCNTLHMYVKGLHSGSFGGRQEADCVWTPQSCSGCHL